MPDEVHISSLIVHVRPEYWQSARQQIAARAGVEIHGANAGTDTDADSKGGKLVVVLETASEAEILAHMTAINEMPGIVATSLIYHEIDLPQHGSEIDRFDRQEVSDA